MVTTNVTLLFDEVNRYWLFSEAEKFKLLRQYPKEQVNLNGTSLTQAENRSCHLYNTINILKCCISKEEQDISTLAHIYLP
jgi:hypothetical protein